MYLSLACVHKNKRFFGISICFNWVAKSTEFWLPFCKLIELKLTVVLDGILFDALFGLFLDQMRV